ncbi:hypothetical protein [Herbiconiux sp. L3-i23]|uniref:hypothetical protein n=1 Tax=Herbiconiux sp. L3-i23 TaxID=2905871 RepID=UPI00204E35AB|nr:hypothetical protein [Herbiconiux sp. L3-i23]BDI21427.1 hypothetical protein L3i23_02030 [Herbiconiux sp. L3-i23]
MSPHPDLHSYLGDFFRARILRATGLRLRRLESLETALHDCIETECDDLLSPDALTLVRLERELDPGCALARMSPVTLLPAVLRRFLTWIPADATNRRLQLQILAAILKAALADRGLVDREDRLVFTIDALTLDADIAEYRKDFERERRALAALPQS